ncbi:MAG: hypothetical protein JWM68_1491 [Verrucomicrobiales bacterium]|nr:hypothetical protein [Verrucomicrobiales bacterium]
MAFLLARYGRRNPVGSLVTLSIIAAIWMFGQWVASSRDHARIRKEVERNGGKLISILLNPSASGWLRSLEGVYEVTFLNRGDQLVLSTCKSGLFSGLTWLDQRILEESKSPSYSNCVKCGTPMPGVETRCAKCGWSYTGPIA